MKKNIKMGYGFVLFKAKKRHFYSLKNFWILLYAKKNINDFFFKSTGSWVVCFV